MSIDSKLAKIEERLGEVDSEIGRLSAIKRKLIAAKEKLNDQKYLEQRNELAQNNWTDGKFFYMRRYAVR